MRSMTDEGRADFSTFVVVAAPSPDACSAGATLSRFTGEG